jgi:hypothetical protein
MKFGRGTLPDVLFTTGLYLLRRSIRTKIDSLAKSGKDAYESLSDRIERTSRSISANSHHPFNRVGSLLLGVGVGLGVGLLIAPAPGDETRGNITKRVEDLGKTSRHQSGRESALSTGTGGV